MSTVRFSFPYSRVPRDLHSFPTRRSSDLTRPLQRVEMFDRRLRTLRIVAMWCVRQVSPRPPPSSSPSKIDRNSRKVRDRKSTRLNSSHVEISYAVFCLKKKKNKYNISAKQ